MSIRTRFSAMPVSSARRTLLAACAVLACAGAASAAEYRDPKNAFGFSYDETVWQTDIDKSGEFGLSCARDACKGAHVGCYVDKERVLFGSVERIMKRLDPERIAAEQMEAFAAQKAELEKSVASTVTWDRGADFAPQLVEPYARHTIAGHPVMRAEFRMSMAGKSARYVSYLTASGSHSIAVVCHANEEAIGEWRPRFEALMAGFQPAPAAKKPR
jgi:hypothetical protein